MGIGCSVVTSSLTLSFMGRGHRYQHLSLSLFVPELGWPRQSWLAKTPLPKLLTLRQGSSRLQRKLFPPAAPTEQCWGWVQEILKR